MDRGQAIMASTESIPPLLNAMVHSQQSSQDQSNGSPGASFLMHSSSMTPLRPSQLESSSPSHPLFLHTSLQQRAISLQQSPCRSQQFPATLKPSLHSSQQSPASLQHQQISVQQSPVRSWKSLRPVSRATLNGSSESPTELQGKTGIHMGSVHPAGVLPTRVHALAASESAGLKQAAADILQGRAVSLEGSLQMAAAISPPPVRGMQSSTHQKGCLGPTQSKPLHNASDLGSSSQPAGKQATAVTDCTREYNYHSSCSMPPDAAVSTVNGSSCRPGRCSLVHASDAQEFVVETGGDAGSGIPSSSTLVTDVTAGAQSSIVKLGSSATGSFADCSSTVSRVSFPLVVGLQHAGASIAAISCSSASKEVELLSALNSAELAFLSGEPSRSLSAGKGVRALCSRSSSSNMRGIKDSSNGKQAASENTGPCARAEKSAALEGSNNGQRLARVGSITARTPPAMRGHDEPSLPVELPQLLRNDDIVLKGGDSEVLLFGEHSNSSVAAAYMTTEANAHADCGCSDDGVKLAENGDIDKLHSCESGLNHRHTSELPAMHASCESLYDDNDWEA